MKYISYEFKKLLGIRYLWIFLVALLLINGGLAFFTARRAQPRGIEAGEISDFFDLYFENTAEMEEYYEKMREWQADQSKLRYEAMRSGDYEYTGEAWVNRFAPEGYSDMALFAQLYASIDTAKSYSSNMQKVINRARANLAEFGSMGISEESYTYKYQLRVIGIYEHLRDNVSIGVEHTRGWGNYFDYDTVNIFIFVILIMFGSVIFAQEKVSGFLSIVRTARHGRGRTALAKLAAMGLVTVGIVLLFTLTTWGIFGLELGYSSASNAIQAFGEFTYCQYIVTVGQYFALSAAVRILTFLVFAALLLALSVFVYNYAVIYAGGLGFFGLNFLLYTLSYLNADNPLKNLNFVATAAANPLFTRFRSINFFSGVWGYVSFMLTVFGILIAAGIAVSLFVFIKRDANGVSFSKLGRLGSKLKEKCAGAAPGRRRAAEAARLSRGYTRRLVLYEIYKTLISSRFLIVVLALLCVKAYFLAGTYRAKNSYPDAVYKEYMTTLEGELTEEKSLYIAAERQYINETKAKYDATRNAYINDEIGYEEFRDYMDDYNYAYSRDEYLKVIESHERYLVEVEKKTGVRAWFLYDTGWRGLVNTGADLYLLAAILLLFAGCFADEYSSRSSSGSFAGILRTTKRGRRVTFRAKLGSAVLISLVAAAVFNASELFIILKNYDTPSLAAPLLSIEQFAALDIAPAASMTVLQYLVLMYSLRALSALLLALFVAGLSELLRKSLPVMSVAVIFTLLPALISYFGFGAADEVNFLNFLGGTGLFLGSSAADRLGYDLGGVILFVAASALIAASALLRARKTYMR